MPAAERILIIGVGNPLMRDEGVGPRAAELLMAGYAFPDNVEVVDAGTMGLSILNLLVDIDHLIVVDAIKDTGHAAGTVLVLAPEDVADNQVMHSLHDMRLSDVLQNAMLIGKAPKNTVLIGVQIERIEEWVLELSPPVEAALPVAIAAVLDELDRLDVKPSPKTDSDIDAMVIEALRTYAPMPRTP
ncbi:MAG: HyaD/HybD family hydrogenase maturation endopeptidase [Coriobacteriia bacterium]|nr:HyaD/HybD family hydrogenase maturation endopeptidase [Coriobacteriia bacterium]